MTREEAIYRLKNMAWLYGSAEREQNIEAIDMAIEALIILEALQTEVVRCKDCKYRKKNKFCLEHNTAVGDKEYIEYSRCSECGEMALVRMNYCPNCGASMKGGTE